VASATYWIAECFNSMRDYQRAIKEYQNFIQKFPRDQNVAEAILKQGNGFYELGMVDDARTFYDKVISTYPKSSAAAQAQAQIAKIEKRKAGVVPPPPGAGLGSYPAETLEQKMQRSSGAPSDLAPETQQQQGARSEGRTYRATHAPLYATSDDKMRTLGIESSCDETAVAIVSEGRVLSNLVATQHDVHARFGGVVPELASRRHMENIVPLVQSALEEADLTLDDIDGIAVTYAPGLLGSLLVGLSAAKAIAYSRKLPIIGVNHLEVTSTPQSWNTAQSLYRTWASLYQAATQASTSCEDSGISNCLGQRATTLPERPLTRSQSCWSWAIPAARPSTGPRAQETPKPFASPNPNSLPKTPLISAFPASRPHAC